MTGGPGVGWTCADPSAITYYTETMLPKVRQWHHGATMLFSFLFSLFIEHGSIGIFICSFLIFLMIETED